MSAYASTTMFTDDELDLVYAAAITRSGPMLERHADLVRDLVVQARRPAFVPPEARLIHQAREALAAAWAQRSAADRGAVDEVLARAERAARAPLLFRAIAPGWWLVGRGVEPVRVLHLAGPGQSRLENAARLLVHLLTPGAAPTYADGTPVPLPVGSVNVLRNARAALADHLAGFGDLHDLAAEVRRIRFRSDGMVDLHTTGRVGYWLPPV